MAEDDSRRGRCLPPDVLGKPETLCLPILKSSFVRNHSGIVVSIDFVQSDAKTSDKGVEGSHFSNYKHKPQTKHTKTQSEHAQLTKTTNKQGAKPSLPPNSKKIRAFANGHHPATLSGHRFAQHTTATNH